MQNLIDAFCIAYNRGRGLDSDKCWVPEYSQPGPPQNGSKLCPPRSFVR